MKKIKFKFRDNYTKGEWRYRECTMDSVEECKEMYGLGIDCNDYEIISVETI